MQRFGAETERRRAIAAGSALHRTGSQKGSFYSLSPTANNQPCMRRRLSKGITHLIERLASQDRCYEYWGRMGRWSRWTHVARAKRNDALFRFEGFGSSPRHQADQPIVNCGSWRISQSLAPVAPGIGSGSRSAAFRRHHALGTRPCRAYLPDNLTITPTRLMATCHSLQRLCAVACRKRRYREKGRRGKP